MGCFQLYPKMIILYLKFELMLICFFRFQREVNFLCRMNHPNIVAIIGITELPDRVGIVMEYINGGNLGDVIEKNGPEMTCIARLKIAIQITSGLSYMHGYEKDQSICHGDLKPNNILLTTRFDVKLVDFGSAALYLAAGVTSDTIKDYVKSRQHTLIYTDPAFLENPGRDKTPAMDMYR